ncbi:uncharacterized protein LOC141849276 isoform X2 [Brevipalpus obovatus]|uniref:uncharacterized protein LOC141849276 isoform X2 n=1 Tax=Brevipalpus obovatus TaxID=246614 RepID=UPI003D9EAF4C
MANINGFKEYMDYFAALEVCLSLAEENIALETELLHYGSEYSELEKCFNELLKLCKSDSVIGPDTDMGYFRVKTETIEKKWKQCKMKSLLMRGMAKRSPLSVVQSHFSRVFPNASSFMANDRLMSDTFPGLHRDTMSTKGFKLNHHRDFYNDFSTFRNFSHTNSSSSSSGAGGNMGPYRLPNHALDLIKGPMSRRSGLSDLIPSHIVNHRVKTLNRLTSGPGSSSSVLDSASEICQTLIPISSHAQRTGRLKENCNSSSSSIGSTMAGSMSISQLQQHQQHSTRRKNITTSDHHSTINCDTHDSDSALQILADEQCLDDVDFKDYDDPDDSLECYLPAAIIFPENLTFRRGKPAHPLPESCNQPREMYQSDGLNSDQQQEAQRQSSRQHHHQRTTAILDGSGVMCYNGEQGIGSKEADSVVDGEKKSKLSKFLLKKWMPHSIFRHKSGSKSSLITSSDWNEAEYNSLPNSSSSTSLPIKSPSTSTSHRNHPSHPSQFASDSSQSKMNSNCNNNNADSNSMSTKNDPNCGPSSCDGLESRMSTPSSGPSSSYHAGNDNNTANRLESTSQSTSSDHHHLQSTVKTATQTASIPSYKSSSSPDLPKALTGLSPTLPASEAHPNTQITLDSRKCEENASSRDYDDVYSSSSRGNGQSPRRSIASEPLMEKITPKDCGTGSDQSVKSSSSLSSPSIAQVIPNGSGSDNNNTNDSIHEAGILPKSFFSLKSVKKAKIKELTPIKLHDQVIPENSSLQVTKPSVISTDIHHHRRNLYEKKHGSRTSRNLRRRRNATRAWYDLSDDEDGLGTGCRNSRTLVPTIQETI